MTAPADPSLAGGTDGASKAPAPVGRFYLYTFVFNLQVWLPVWVLYLQRERGLSLSEITALDAPFWLVVMLAQVPTGAFADRWGRRLSLMVGALIFAAALLVFGTASSYPIILASYLLWAVSLAFSSGADMALLYDNLAAAGRADEYGRAAGRTFALNALATVASLFFGAWIASRTRLDVPVLVAAATSVVAAGIALTLHEAPRTRARRVSFVATVRLGAVAAWRDKRLRYILAFSAVIRATGFTPVILIQPFLAHYGTPVSRLGLLQMPGVILGIGATLVTHRVQAALPAHRLFAGLMSWIAACLLLLSLWGSPFAFIAFPLMAPVLRSADPIFSSYLNRHIPEGQRATVLSLGSLLSSMLMIGFEPLIGVTAQAGGLQAGFLFALSFLVLCGSATLAPWLLSRHGD